MLKRTGCVHRLRGRVTCGRILGVTPPHCIAFGAFRCRPFRVTALTHRWRGRLWCDYAGGAGRLERSDTRGWWTVLHLLTYHLRNICDFYRPRALARPAPVPTRPHAGARLALVARRRAKSELRIHLSTPYIVPPTEPLLRVPTYLNWSILAGFWAFFRFLSPLFFFLKSPLFKSPFACKKS